MVADHVDVYSHSASDNTTYCWSSQGYVFLIIFLFLLCDIIINSYYIHIIFSWFSLGEYEITKSTDAPRGTTIVLHLKEDQKKYAIDQTVQRIIKKYSNFVNHTIRLNGNEVNTVRAIWAMDKSSITEQQYLDFYHFVGQG